MPRVRIYLSVQIGARPSHFLEVDERQAKALHGAAPGQLVSVAEWWVNPAHVVAIGPAPERPVDPATVVE